MSAHTPGPWAVWPMGRILAITCTGRSKPHPSEGMHVAAVHMPEHNTQHDELWQANARLIAAAPDLLAALSDLLSRAKKELADPEDVPEVYGAEQVIARAIGAKP